MVLVIQESAEEARPNLAWAPLDLHSAPVPPSSLPCSSGQKTRARPGNTTKRRTQNKIQLGDEESITTSAESVAQWKDS